MNEQKYDDIRYPTPGFEQKTTEITNIKTPRSTGKNKKNSKNKTVEQMHASQLEHLHTMPLEQIHARNFRSSAHYQILQII